MLTKLANETFVPAVPGRAYQPYSKTCPPVQQQPGAIPSSPVVVTLTAWTVGGELTLVDQWTMEDPHPSSASVTHSRTYAIYQANPPDGNTYAIAMGSAPWTSPLSVAEETGISNVGVFGKLLRVLDSTHSFSGVVYDSDGAVNVEKSAALDVYAVDQRVFQANAQKPSAWFGVASVPLKVGDSIYPIIGAPAAGAFWSQVFDRNANIILRSVIATLLEFDTNDGSVSLVPGGGHTGVVTGSGGVGGQSPSPATGCITYTNDPSSESGPHEGGATGGSSITVCFG